MLLVLGTSTWGVFSFCLSVDSRSPQNLCFRHTVIWLCVVLLASTTAQACAWSADQNKATEACFPFQRILCSSWRCHFSSWLVCWLSNMLHFVKQGCFSFLAFVAPSAAFFFSLYIPPHLLKQVELILAKCSRFNKNLYQRIHINMLLSVV